MKLKYLLGPLVFIAMGMFATANYARNDTVSIIRAPATAVKGVAVAINITVDPYCSHSVDFGNGGTPISHRSNLRGTGNFGRKTLYYRPIYSSSGLKFIIVRVTTGGARFCSVGRTTTKRIRITSPVPAVPTISSIRGRPCARKGSSYRIRVNGSGGNGICTLNVTWGDGKNGNYRNYRLNNSPLGPRLSHIYRSIIGIGYMTIKVSGSGGCVGTARKTVIVRNNCDTTPTIRLRRQNRNMEPKMPWKKAP
jgi:hypothetical protein